MNKYSITKTTNEKNKIENKKRINNNIFSSSLFILSAFSLFFSILIIIVVFTKGTQSFTNGLLSIPEFLFGNKYDGITKFAAGFMIINTIWTSFLAVIIALPISLLTAIFITRIAPNNLKSLFFIVLSLLAAIPSVIYGAFGSFVIDSIVRTLFGVGSGTILTIVVTLAFMIMPTITMITVSSINSVDKKMEHSSLALGATRNQTSFYITLKAASTGILTATILGIGRALGEATAISMISSDPYFGPTFGLFDQIRLLTSTMLKGYNEMAPGSIAEASMFAMASLLIITIIVIFMTMRWIEKKTSPQYKSKISNKKINEKNKLVREIQNKSFLDSSKNTQREYIKIKKEIETNKQIDDWYKNKYEKQTYIKNTTIKVKNSEKRKKIISNIFGGLTITFAMFGVIFLVSIILYLLLSGSESLSWDYISSSGVFNYNGIEVQGLRTAILGTFILIILSMIFIIPLGVGAGIYFSQFAKKNKINNFLKSSIDLISGMPSLIFGVVGAVIFLPFSKAIGFAPLAGALIMTFIVIPTVIKATQEAIDSVPKSHINGSLALGSTKTSSSLKVVIPQTMPEIISSLILAVGRIIGESAAIVIVFGTISRDNISDWLSFGGTTLSTEMYRLTLLDVIPWNLVASIGIVILSIILLLSLLSNYISKKEKIGTFGILFSIILFLISIYISNELLFLISIIILLLIIILDIFKKFLLKKVNNGKRIR